MRLFHLQVAQCIYNLLLPFSTAPDQTKYLFLICTFAYKDLIRFTGCVFTVLCRCGFASSQTANTQTVFTPPPQPPRNIKHRSDLFLPSDAPYPSISGLDLLPSLHTTQLPPLCDQLAPLIFLLRTGRRPHLLARPTCAGGSAQPAQGG